MGNRFTDGSGNRNKALGKFGGQGEYERRPINRGETEMMTETTTSGSGRWSAWTHG